VCSKGRTFYAVHSYLFLLLCVVQRIPEAVCKGEFVAPACHYLLLLSLGLSASLLLPLLQEAAEDAARCIGALM
jgi:hypothetical protein